MSKLDPEILYLILTKVSARESYYNYDPKQIPASQKPGTITHQQLADVFERVTGNRPGASLIWSRQIQQLDAILKLCGLPSLGVVVVDPSQAEINTELLGKAQATKWPPFGSLKNLYRK